MQAMAFIAFNNACEKDNVENFDMFASVSSEFGSRLPVIITDTICTIHKIQGILGSPKALPAMPKINAGPALLQKPSILEAEFLEILPDS